MYQKDRPYLKWLLLALLILLSAASILSIALQSELLTYFTPITVFYSFIANVLYPLSAMPLYYAMLAVFVVLPLIGWLLLGGKHRVGKALLLVPHAVLLAMNSVVTVLHIIISFAEKSSESLAASALLALVTIAESILVLVFTCLWQPKRG